MEQKRYRERLSRELCNVSATLVHCDNIRWMCTKYNLFYVMKSILGLVSFIRDVNFTMHLNLKHTYSISTSYTERKNEVILT